MAESRVLLNRMLAKVRLRHLQALVTLADLGHVHRAAQSMGMAQPAMSLLLGDVERLVEAPLFLRHSRGVVPTPLMLELLPLLRQMLARLEEGAELIARRVERDQGLVRVVATAAGANGLLSCLLPVFALEHPEIQVMVSEVDNPTLGAVTQSGAADIVFCRQPEVMPQDWAFTDCLSDEFVVVCGLGHPLVGQAVVSMDELMREKWLPNTVGSAARQRQEQLLQQQGWDLPSSTVVTRISVLTWTLLDSDRLLTLVPRSVVRPWIDRRQLAVLPISHTLPFDPVGMLTPRLGMPRACEVMARFVMDRVPW